MRIVVVVFLCLQTVLAWAAAPLQLRLDVARFRPEDRTVKGAVVELFTTVSTQQLLYKQRGPKLFQAAAALTLEVVRPDGAAVYQETVTLKPPVLRDTTAANKNPLNFQKRLILPPGTYTVRAQVRDQYQTGSLGLVERALVVAEPTGKPQLSDIVLLSRPAARTAAEPTAFVRNGLSLTRAAGALYARGQEKLYFYAELYDAPAGQGLTVRYRVRAAGAAKDALTGQHVVQAASGRPTTVAGELAFGSLAAGEYVLTLEIRNATNKPVTTQTARFTRNLTEYAPTGAVVPR
ncbi:hypothetical protein [Hymenobacter weizhouensis]|uniref:hypothetical protein n=1 Tax=Hymenobacter sp. YIM 151500-1 TaxID=2987689 RepID=UPI0022273238|nr:hypothetical protein [Hymenobacter sp. YIM 151500-1]UYZ65112.1 hypothetical protein OIS53_09720 [Hymenobacter sp. YIM 151500-1]